MMNVIQTTALAIGGIMESKGNMKSELELMLKGYTEQEKQVIRDKAESMDKLLKALSSIEKSYTKDGSLKVLDNQPNQQNKTKH